MFVPFHVFFFFLLILNIKAYTFSTKNIEIFYKSLQTDMFVSLHVLFMSRYWEGSNRGLQVIFCDRNTWLHIIMKEKNHCHKSHTGECTLMYKYC